MKWIGIPGTGDGWEKGTDHWWHPQSAFAGFLADHGLTPAKPDKPFKWSGGLQGVPLLDLFAGHDWEAGAAAFADYVDDIPPHDRNVIAHSHGGQVALIACAEYDVDLHSLVMVGTPVRKDIEAEIAPEAIRHIDRAIHITDAHWDTWGFLGALFDFRVSTRRTFKVPGLLTDQARRIGHSGILTDRTKFALWEVRGWLRVLTGAAV